jgi:hypothetical protein
MGGDTYAQQASPRGGSGWGKILRPRTRDENENISPFCPSSQLTIAQFIDFLRQSRVNFVGGFLYFHPMRKRTPLSEFFDAPSLKILRPKIGKAKPAVEAWTRCRY